MSKSTATYWNVFDASHANQWESIEGTEMH